MTIKEAYKKVKKALLTYKNEGKITEFREEQLYFTALIMGIVSIIDNKYETFKKTELEKNHSKRYNQGIIDAESIELTENVLFEAMGYNEELLSILPYKKEQK